MWPRFGIKVGNSTLCISYTKSADAKPDVIANKQGDRNSQACLLWDGVSNEIECGLTAKQKMSTRPKQAVANSFQLLLPSEKLTEECIATASKQIPCDYDSESQQFNLSCNIPSDNDSDEDKEITYQLSAYEVQVQLLRAELELARQYHSNSCSGGDSAEAAEASTHKPIAVLSIPSYYPEESWPLLAQAAEEAGFHVAQIVAEPTAAVLAYGIGETPSAEGAEDTKYVLTIKCGGLFSHFAVYAVRNGLYSQVAAYGPFPIGGKHFTETLVQFICEEFQRKYKLDPHESRRSVAKIRTTAANCKHILTTMPTTQLYIDSLMDGIDFNAQMSRARFEMLIQPVISNFMQTLNECVDKKDAPRIDAIVLLGATMQIPKLQAAIASRFPQAELHASISADEVVAVGCARQSAFVVNPRVQELHGSEECICAEEELAIWHGEDETNAQVLLSKGSLLPRTVVVDVKRSENAANAELFRLRVGKNINEVCLSGAVPSSNDVFRIEAMVDYTEEKSEASKQQVTPMVRLRCCV